MTVAIQSPNGANFTLPALVSFTAKGDRQFSVSDNVTQDWLRSFFYVLDGQDMRTCGLRFEGTKTTEIYGNPVYRYRFSGQANLTDLTDGLHSITVYYGAVNSVALIGSPDEMIVYNSDWSATTQFYVDSALTPSTIPLIIDLANGNYINDVTVGQSVHFSAVVSNGAPPYTFQWYYRQYYVGSAVGDVYPIGDAMLGSDSQNFTFTANSAGYYLISVEVWDSAGAEGYFMSISNPGIWVNAVAPTPTPSPTISPTPSPSTTPSLTPTISPNMTPSSSPTQQPTLELSPASDNIQVENYAPMIILAGLVVIAVSVSLVVCFRRRK
jgi:PKD domain